MLAVVLVVLVVSHSTSRSLELVFDEVTPRDQWRPGGVDWPVTSTTRALDTTRSHLARRPSVMCSKSWPADFCHHCTGTAPPSSMSGVREDQRATQCVSSRTRIFATSSVESQRVVPERLRWIRIHQKTTLTPSLANTYRTPTATPTWPGSPTRKNSGTIHAIFFMSRRARYSISRFRQRCLDFQHNLSTTITGNSREWWVICQLTNGLRTRPLTSNCKEFTGFPRRKTFLMVRFRKPPLSPY